jgi:hypothetical protein
MTLAITFHHPHSKVLDGETHQYQDLSRLNISESATPYQLSQQKYVTDSGFVAAQEPASTPEPQTQHQELSDYHRIGMESNSRPKRLDSIALRRSASTTKKIKPVYPLRIDVDPSKLTVKRKKSANLPLTSEQHESILSPSIMSPVSNHIMNMDLGDLDEEEHDVLRKEIRARRLIRKQKKTYADDDMDDSESESRVKIGTRVSEGHRNYQMM